MNIASHTKYLFVLIFFVAILAAITACSRPQAAPQNRELITSLRTAVSARKTDWLELNVKKIEDRRAAGEVSDLEYEEFQKIIAMAREGNWEKAEREAVAFQKSQKPTPEEVQRVTQRQK